MSGVPYVIQAPCFVGKGRPRPMLTQAPRTAFPVVNANTVISVLAQVRRCVTCRRRPHGSVEVTVAIEGDAPLGLHAHAGERDAALQRLMRRTTGKIARRSRAVLFPEGDEESAKQLVRSVNEVLTKIAHKPISQRRVESLLDITSAERRRWSKDGRLKPSGSARIRRGSLISLPTYSPVMIEQLLKSPAILADWRAFDASQQQHWPQHEMGL